MSRTHPMTEAERQELCDWLRANHIDPDGGLVVANGDITTQSITVPLLVTPTGPAALWCGGMSADLDTPSVKCSACLNGYTPARVWLQRLVQRLGMLADYADGDRSLHPWLRDDPYPPTADRTVAMPPSEDILDLWRGLSGTGGGDPGGRVSSDGWPVERALITAAGLDSDVWGICRQCQGEGEVPA